MSKKYFLPLASFDVHLTNLKNLTNEFKKDNDISDLINIINTNYWSTDITMNVFQKDYDALVLTDKKQKIIWVSSGFNNMTGYSKSYAVGKKPAFLQGDKTSPYVKKQIRSDLKNNHSYSGSIINYKKNGQVYNCQIKISPIYSSKKSLKYFLAFEKEIAMV
jgi:PAS domain S-box-containing protein